MKSAAVSVAVSVALTVCVSPLSARRRAEEEEGGAHRPGDNELRESVSTKKKKAQMC